MTDAIFNWLNNLTGSVAATVLIVAVLPIFEARLAIPIAIKCGLSPLDAFLYGYLGSTLAAIPLLLFLLPLFNLLAKTRLFKGLADAVLTKAQGKAQGIKGGDGKKILGVMAFEALPLPLTGVWTGSLLCGILGLNFFKSFFCIAIGNFLAALIITVASVCFAEYINIIVGVFFAIALFSVIVLLIKAFLPPKQKHRR